jgi:DNA-binding winged helix-turn-helix (wHTH) protein/TolB-like protein
MASSPNPTHEESRGRVWQFADCEFDELRHELRVHGQTVELEGKPLEVLHQLLLHAGEVVHKESLLESVWPGVLVVDASLATAVSKLRRVLGDESIIKTVPKVGYRFSVPVRISDHAALDKSTNELPSFPGVIPPEIIPSDLGTQAHPRRRLVGWTLLAALLITLSLSLTAFRPLPNTDLVPGPVAILPFQNVSSNSNYDYLRSALPDEVANTLSAARSLTIRPLAQTNRYSDPSLDLRKVARELNVSRLVTGHYVLAGEHLQITMEAVDTDRNSILWHDTVNVPVNNLLALQAQVAAMSRGKLAKSLGITDFVRESMPRATNEEAYELYLKSIALDWDPAPNKEGIALLRRAVLLDPSYAPAWGMLSLRYYTLSRFGGGGPEILRLSDAAAEKQLALDPDSSDAVAELTIHRTERGEIVQAHQQALELLRRRPDVANNHHLLSYVLRYGGSIEEAGHECDMTVLLATKIIWGSCSSTFMELGNYPRAMDFVRKDLSSEWSKAHAIEVRLREGKTDQAIKIGAPKIEHWDSYKMLLACAQHAPESQIRTLASGVEVDDDPEVNYFFAAHLAYCGQNVAALRMLKLAIDRNYCSYPTMDKDPFFDKLRNDPAFGKVRAAGIACHENFVANREQTPKMLASESVPSTQVPAPPIRNSASH